MSTMRPKSRQHGFGLVAAMFVIIIITAVTLISTLVPAIVASRIPPIAAMQAKE